MLTGLLISLIVTALAIHYFFVERPRRQRLSVKPALPEPIPPRQALNSLPDGAYLQTGFTWTRILDNGDILVGIHPILVSLVGAPYSLKVMPEGWRVAKGSPVVRLRQGKREIRIGSPVNGRIAEVNPNACMEQGWSLSGSGDDTCWIYRMEAQNVFHEAPLWLEGEAAEAWSREKYQQIRDQLISAAAHQEVGLALADGGEMPMGILGQLPDDAWEGFQDAFLPSVPKK
jgi:glycine cleavage system H lipoate-binding protein